MFFPYNATAAAKEAALTNKKETPERYQQSGQINIAEEVIASIASIAASEVEGLADVKQGAIAEIVGIFGGRQKGVDVRLDEKGRVNVNLKVTVAYGHPIHEVARRIQHKVTEDIRSMTGLEVEGVNIYVKDLKLTSGLERRGQAEEVHEASDS